MKEFSLSNLRVELRSALPPQHATSDQIERALNLAFEAHEGQFREPRDSSSTRIPYITHPVGVAKIAAAEWRDGEMVDTFKDVISAALTHDVLEDSRINFHELVARTSARSAELVLALTKPLVGHRFTNNQRNAALAEQIRANGATARFIKLCDSIHNLSRPNGMPIGLLVKSIRKARRDYLPLREGQPFCERLGGRLEQTIQMAEAALASERAAQSDTRLAELDNVFEHFGNRARGKVLEDHDIIALVSEIPGISRCAIQSLDNFFCQTLASKEGGRGFERKRDRYIERGEIVLQPGENATVDPARVFLAPLSTDGSRSDQRFVLAWINETERPAWLTPHSFLAAVTLLTDRLRARESRELIEYAEAISHFGLDVHARSARDAHLSPLQMKTLRGLLDTAVFLQGNLISALEATLKLAGSSDAVDRIERRVKTSGSILRKMQLRGLAEVTDIDDLIGVRIIFASARVRDQFASILDQQLQADKGDFHRIVAIADGSVRMQKTRSDSGYAATHVYLQLEGPLAEPRYIACEIQLRTIFEDAWARVSQIFAYKDDVNTARYARLLHALSELRDRADDEISKVK